MAERVSTGGNMSFEYGKSEARLDDERKESIKEGYEKYYERRRREKRNKAIMIVAGIVILIIVLLIVF